MDIHDLSTLKQANIETILEVLGERYDAEKYFTLASSVLLQLSSPDDSRIKQELQDSRSGKGCGAVVETAHLFSFLSRIFRQLTYDKTSHTIFISGEAGAGKSATANNATLFLTGKQPEIASRWECAQVLIQAISSTPHESHKGSSTRSIIIQKVFFADNGVVSGGEFALSGMELPRLWNQEAFNYNIFYYITYGLSDEQKNIYYIPAGKKCEFTWLKNMQERHGAFEENFTTFNTAFRFIIKAPKLQDYFLCTLGAILHLGDIRLLSTPSGIVLQNSKALEISAELLHLEVSDLKTLFLLHHEDVKDAYSTIREFAMNLYSALCSWLIECINASLLTNSSLFDPTQPSISVVDLYGYSKKEKIESLPNLLINISNEQLMQQFNNAIQKDHNINLNCGDSCADFFGTLHQTIFTTFHESTDEEHFQNELKRLCTSSVFGDVNGSDNTLHCDHFFHSVSYDISQLYRAIRRSSLDMVSKVHAMTCKTLSLWMDSLFLQSVSSKVSRNLFTERNKLPMGTITKPHFIFCVRSSNDETLPFDPLYISKQLKAHNIIKLVSKNNTHTPMVRVSLLKTPQKISQSHSFSDDVSLASPKKRSRSKYKENGHLSHSRSTEKIAMRAKKAKSYSGKKGKSPRRPISLRLRSAFDSKSKDRDSDTRISLQCMDLATVVDQVSSLPPTPTSTPPIPPAYDPDYDICFILSSDDLSDISELSETEDDQSDLSSPLGISSNSLLPIIVRSSVVSPKVKEHRNQFLIMYSCGSLLRSYTIEDQDNNRLSSILSPHRLEPISKAISPSRRCSTTELPMIPDALSKIQSQKSQPRLNAIHNIGEDSGNISDMHPSLQQSASEIQDREMKEWERKSFRMQRQSILPLLNLESGDEVVNQVNYNNRIRTTPRITKPSFSIIQGSTFQSYAETRFLIDKCKVGSSKHRTKLKKLTSATKSPLKRPLHPLRPPFDKLAVENFRHILMYAASKPGGGHRSNAAFAHVRGILELGLERARLRDEIYCQIVKQTQNMKEKSEILMWELLAICCGCFAPCNFYHCLIHFLEQTCLQSGEIGSWAAFCLERLLKISIQGKRLFVPINREIISIQDRKPLFETFYFMDGKIKQIPIYSTTTTTEALEFLLQMIGLRNTDGYMIYEEYKIFNKNHDTLNTTVHRSLLYSEVLCTSLSKFEAFASSFDNKDHITVETNFIVKKKLFLAAVEAADPVEENLLFHQVSDLVSRGKLLVKENSALALGGLLLQTKGNYVSSSSIPVKEVVPPDLIDLHSMKVWRKSLGKRHKELAGISPSDARSTYLNLAKMLPFYGYHLFWVVDASPVSSNWNFPSNSFYIAVHMAGVFLINQYKDVYYSFPFLDIFTHESTPYSVILTMEDSRKLKAKTQQGDEIVSLIIDYKYHELKDD